MTLKLIAKSEDFGVFVSSAFSRIRVDGPNRKTVPHEAFE